MEKDGSQTTITDLTDDVLVSIGEYLSMTDVLAFGSTCKGLMFLRRDNLLWVRFFRARFTIPKRRQERLQKFGGTVCWIEEYFWRARLSNSIVFEFNKLGDLQKGLDFLEREGFTSSEAMTTELIATHPYVSRRLLGDYLLAFPSAQTRFFSSLRLGEVDILSGFRAFLAANVLPKESQAMRKHLHSYANAYYEANLETALSRGWTRQTLYVFVYATLLVNVDAHNPLVQTKMSSAQFVAHMASIAPELDTATVSEAYASVVGGPFVFGESCVLLRASAPLYSPGYIFSWTADFTLVLSVDCLKVWPRGGEGDDEKVAVMLPQPLVVSVQSFGKNRSTCLVIQAPEPEEVYSPSTGGSGSGSGSGGGSGSGSGGGGEEYGGGVGSSSEGRRASLIERPLSPVAGEGDLEGAGVGGAAAGGAEAGGGDRPPAALPVLPPVVLQVVAEGENGEGGAGVPVGGGGGDAAGAVVAGAVAGPAPPAGQAPAPPAGQAPAPPAGQAPAPPPGQAPAPPPGQAPAPPAGTPTAAEDVAGPPLLRIKGWTRSSGKAPVSALVFALPTMAEAEEWAERLNEVLNTLYKPSFV